MTKLEAVLDLLELGELDFILCQADHRRPIDVECLHEATHRVTMVCRVVQDPLVCEHVVMVNRAYSAEGRLCGKCARPAAECWGAVKL